ncbi:hypothetical protein BGZ97_006024 [Linnemannia gamsii]|jgi:hypothetical protein|uniref:Galactose oxidase n=1 Tax=Linnemannia gamsii TaxID=64522 RepID=A0A9P6QTS4_9FUNG|nr:hypothetical protein BGZ97_006024 [Linnemannia gamsii]
MPLSYSLSTAVLMFLLLPLSLPTTITHVQAQPSPPPTTGPYNPAPLYNAHSVFIEGDALYVHGGISDANSPPQAQLFALDLSVSWKTTQPTFKKLFPGFPSAGVTSALLKDSDTWMMFDGNKYIFYYIQMDRWSESVMQLQLNPKIPGFPAVTDFSSGLVYVVNGFIEPGMSAAAVGTISMMLTFQTDGDKQVFSTWGQGSEFSLVENGFAGCWSTIRKSILLHGGLAGSPVAIYQKTMFEYNTTTHGFKAASDKGVLPTARAGHCMVEAYNGTKIVLFGGVDSTSSGLADIYFLDVATMEWTAGKTGGAGVGRAYAACAVTNDRFVAWGGATRVNGTFVAVSTSNPTIVYDFIQNKWITTFSPLRTNPSDPDPSTPPTTPPAGEETNSSSSKGALIGGIAGGVVVVVAIAVFIFFCRRRAARRKQKREKKMSFSTFEAMPVVAIRTASSSDDSLPDHQQHHRKNTREISTREDDDQEEDEDEGRKYRDKPKDEGSGMVTYVVEARAMPSSPTESSFRDSRITPQSHAYQQLQQQQPVQQPPPPLQQPLQPIQSLPEQQHAYSSASRVPYPVPPATAAANGSTGYEIPVLKFFNPITTTPTTPASIDDTINPIPVPSSPVASISPLPPPLTPQRPQSLIPGGFAIPRVIRLPPSSSQPQEPIKSIDPSYITLIPYASPVASVSSIPPQSIVPALNSNNNVNNVNNKNTQAYTSDQYHDQDGQGKEEMNLHHQQHPRPPPTVEYGPNSSPALSYLACSSQWTSSLGSTPGVALPIPAAPGAPGAAGPYSTFSPSPLSAVPTTATPVPTTGGGGSGDNAHTTFSPSPLSWYSDSTEARNSLPFVPVVSDGYGTSGCPQKLRDEGLMPPVTPPRNPHGIQ